MKYTVKFRSGGSIDLYVPEVSRGDLIQLTLQEKSVVPGIAPTTRTARYEVDQVLHIFELKSGEQAYCGTELKVSEYPD